MKASIFMNSKIFKKMVYFSMMWRDQMDQRYEKSVEFEERSDLNPYSFDHQEDGHERQSIQTIEILCGELQQQFNGRRQLTKSKHQKLHTNMFMNTINNRQSQIQLTHSLQQSETKQEEQQAFYNSYFHLQPNSNQDQDYFRRDQATCSDQLQEEETTFCEDRHQFEEFINDLERGDFAFLRRVEKKLLKSFKLVFQHWDIFKFELQPLFPRFIDLMRFRLCQKGVLAKINQRILGCLDHLERLFEYKGSRQNIVFGRSAMDNLFKHYIQEIFTRNIRKGLYKIQTSDGPIILEQYVEKIEEFLLNPQWSSLFSLSSYFIFKSSDLSSNYISSQKEKKEKFSQNIYKIPSVPCQDNDQFKFVYQQQNIFDSEINQSHVSLLGGIQHLDEQNSKIIFFKQITSLLNSEGGIAMWDCYRKYLQVLPKGEIMNENQKVKIKRKVKNLLQRISPKVELGVDCTLQFIPVALNPLNQPNETNPEFIQGCYVTVLKVFKRSLKSEMYVEQRSAKQFVKLHSLHKPTVYNSKSDCFFDKEKAFLELKGISTSKNDPKSKLLIEKLSKCKENKQFVVPLFGLENQEEVEGIQLFKSDTISRLKKKYEFLADSLQKDITDLIENDQDPEKLQLIKENYFFFSFLVSVIQKVEENLKKLEHLCQLYIKDKKHCFLHSKKIEEVERYYDAIVKSYEEQFQVLMDCREDVADKYQHLGSKIFTKEENIELGKPLTTKKKYTYDVEGDPQKIFEFATVLISQRENISLIEKKLIKNGIQCLIKPLPNTNKFRGIPNSSVIYHHCVYSKIASLVRGNKQFQFNGKHVTIGALTKYIQLSSRSRANELSYDDFKMYSQCLNSIFKEEVLTMWKHNTQNGNIEYYLSTGSRIATLLVYLIINHYGEKGIIKNIESNADPIQRHKDISRVYPKA